MKKFLILLALLSISVSSFAGSTPGSGIAGSPHDMNIYAGATADSQGRVCAFCHTPHHALSGAAPLWSHTLTAETFTPYTSSTLDSAAADSAAVLTGPTVLCMSCHDGAIAVDQHYNVAGTANTTTDGWDDIAVGKSGSTDNDHPVGMSYVAAASADNEIKDLAGLQFPGSNVNVADVLEGGVTMTCATCHDVHNTSNVAHTTDSSKNYFLYADQTGSALCLTCHAK